jgi:hypothetical protein
MFIVAAIVHLFSIGGFIQTTSLYPGAPSPVPAPGIIAWTGYLIPPVIPIPNINFPSEDGSEPPVIEQPDNLPINEIGPIQEYEIPTDEDILGGDTSFENVVNTSLPDDIEDELNINKQIEEFKKQLVAIRPDCIKN